VTLITYQRQIVALAGAHRFDLAPAIDDLPDGDPLKTFVCFLALYARDVHTGELPGDPTRYVPCRGERYARAALMPAHEFSAQRHRSDHGLATHFGVPSSKSLSDVWNSPPEPTAPAGRDGAADRVGRAREHAIRGEQASGRRSAPRTASPREVS